jgi:UDP-2-acetamido-3-amino-2,3-dideoxy-glucuronate N-acetyltransferase
VSEAFVHPTAIREEGVTIGDGTKVWHHCHLRSGAQIGTECVLGKNVFVDAGVTIGSFVKVQNNVSVYAGVTIEDEVFVGPSAVFTNDMFPRARSANWEIVATRVHRGASIGANATIVCGRDIGPYAMVGAGSVVTRAVGAHVLVVGNPAKQKGWVCHCGNVVARGAGEPPSADKRCAACGEPWWRGLE